MSSWEIVATCASHKNLSTMLDAFAILFIIGMLKIQYAAGIISPCLRIKHRLINYASRQQST